MIKLAALQDVTIRPTGNKNPLLSPDDDFLYVDVAAVDNDTKQIHGAKKLLGADAPSRARKLLKSGDVIVSTVRPNLNAVALVSPELDGAIGSTGFCVLRANPKLIIPEYLFFFVRSQVFIEPLLKLVSGALYPAVSDNQVLAQLLPVPSLQEQQRIVDILSRAEGIVRLRREAQKKAAEIIPALFLDTFGDPATNPKGWPLRSFSELGSLDRGRSRHRPRDAEELYDGPYPFIQTGDVANSGGLITRYTSTYSEAGLAQSRLWSKGTLCITIAANIAQTGVLDFDACFPDSVVGFVGGDDVTTEYIQVWLAFLQPSLEAYAPQVAQKNINLDILRKLPVMSPPLALQEQFTARYNQLLALRKLHESSLEAAQATFDALLAQSFAPPTAQQAAA